VVIIDFRWSRRSQNYFIFPGKNSGEAVTKTDRGTLRMIAARRIILFFSAKIPVER